jgi:hypothetical protein
MRRKALYIVRNVRCLFPAARLLVSRDVGSASTPRTVLGWLAAYAIITADLPVPFE